MCVIYNTQSTRQRKIQHSFSEYLNDKIMARRLHYDTRQIMAQLRSLRVTGPIQDEYQRLNLALSTKFNIMD